MNEFALPLAQYLRAESPDRGEVAAIIYRLAVAGKVITRELRHAALAGRLGSTGDTNVQGEQVKKLDVWANDVVVRALQATGLVSVLVSEEMEEPKYLAESGPYVVCFDPVDGSSNLDVNGIVGTVFSIRRRQGRTAAEVMVDALQPGTSQVAAGYIMYGPSTILVFTMGAGVDAFTLEPSIGEWVQSHGKITPPRRGRTYSVNDANAPVWEAGVREYVDYLRTRDAASGRPYTARYVGSMVADVHRTLIDGGVFLYPAEAGKSAGKLRLQYEAAPMAFVMEQAGGHASTGRERIQAVVPTTPHQRVPLVIGSREDVELAEEFIAGRRSR